MNFISFSRPGIVLIVTPTPLEQPGIVWPIVGVGINQHSSRDC